MTQNKAKEAAQAFIGALVVVSGLFVMVSAFFVMVVLARVAMWMWG